LESQRVKGLTEGYLRGWLDFKYPLKTSTLREEIIIKNIQDEWYYNIVSNKTQVYSALMSAGHKLGDKSVSSLNKMLRELVELKLPYLLPKDRIQENDSDLSREELIKWREVLTKLNDKK
jgi:hypothetical protein